MVILFIALSQLFIVDTLSACVADGSFSLDPPSYSLWASSGFFQITLAFGTFSFTSAKVVDVVWDVVSASHDLAFAQCCMLVLTITDRWPPWTSSSCAYQLAGVLPLRYDFHGAYSCDVQDILDNLH